MDQTTTPPVAIPAIWPEGLLYGYFSKESRTGIEIQARYEVVDSNTIVAGATYEKQKVYDFNISQNYLESGIPNVYIQLPSLREFGDINSEAGKRDFKAFFMEDIWDITQNIRLTTGLRYDRYSDFGGHFSPRAGLTWEYIKGYDLKLLYGNAFLAPTFNQILYSAPGTTLGPQIVDTYEVSLGADFTSSLSSRITLYQKDDKDLITVSLPSWPYNYLNIGKRRTKGIEVEAKYDFGRGTYLAGNYAYISCDEIPIQLSHSYYIGKIMSNIRLSRYLNFYADGFHIGGLTRGGLGISVMMYQAGQL